MQYQTMNLVLTRRNQVGYPDRNRLTNVFRLNFTTTAKIPEGSTVCLAEANIYNCFRNVLSAYGNNTFSVTWVNNVTYNFVIEDGGYGISEIGSYLEAQFYNYQLFWQNGQEIVYPFSIKENATGYACQIVCVPIPSQAQVTASNGSIKKTSTAWSFPTNSTTATLTLCEPLAVMLGYVNSDSTTQRVFPTSGASSDVVSFNSTVAPDMKSVESIIVKTNFLNNNLLGQDHFDTLAIIANNVSFGELKEYKAPYERNLSVSPADYQFFELTLYDNEYRALNSKYLIDSDITFNVQLNIPIKPKQ